jgi:hypothetical protein
MAREVRFMLSDADAAILDEIQEVTGMPDDATVCQSALGAYWGVVQEVRKNPDVKLMLVDEKNRHAQTVDFLSLQNIRGNKPMLPPSNGTLH